MGQRICESVTEEILHSARYMSRDGAWLHGGRHVLRAWIQRRWLHGQTGSCSSQPDIGGQRSLTCLPAEVDGGFFSCDGPSDPKNDRASVPAGRWAGTGLQKVLEDVVADRLSQR